MRRAFSTAVCIGLGVIALSGRANAQAAPVATPADPCAGPPDTVIFRGNTRLSDATVRADAGIKPGQPLNSRNLNRAEQALFAEGQYEDMHVDCLISGGKRQVVFTFIERPELGAINVKGVTHVSETDVKDRIDLLIERPIDPSDITRAITRIDSLYASQGFYLAHVTVDTAMKDGKATLTFKVDEGRRLAVSGVFIEANKGLNADQIVRAMQTKPEGFFWWEKGELDDDMFATDLVQNLPAIYASHGFIDMQVVQDTLEIDKARGKALIRIRVKEGPQYHVGSFEVDGERHFSEEDIAGYYPFGANKSKTLVQVVKGLATKAPEKGVYDANAWEDATQAVSDAYTNDGYIFARVIPVAERVKLGPDSVPTVNLRWDITEGSPAIINRVDIVGNDITSEACIRDQLFVFPGDVYSKDRLLRSWENIGSLGFFNTPLPLPDIQPSDDHQTVDLTLKVTEKHTGQMNFGASVGQGTGLGGFIGFDQPNLFGLCKKGSVQWQYGQYINNFSLSYTDPHIEGSRLSGAVTGYHSQSRFTIADLGQSIETGGDVRIGFPLANSRVTRLYVDYGGERVKYGSTGLVGQIACNGCWRSTMGLTVENDTRIGAPFPFAGSSQTITSAFNGGPLGGSAEFTRYTGEMSTYSRLASLGNTGLGAAPAMLVFGLDVKGGALFGDPGPFFVSQSFSLGGTQYGESLRGYPEFSITPSGYVPNASEFQATRTSFGNAFYTVSSSLNLRVSDQLNIDLFYDAGNIWNRPQDFDPTRLFRGAGFGAAIVTPLGPLGIDVGYGFDRTDANGHPAPAWQVHFKFGQLF